MKADRFTLDNLGNSWGCLQEKAHQEYATLLGIKTGLFTASPGWITYCLKWNGEAQLNLHGEAGDMDPANRAAIMDEWRTKEFWPLIEIMLSDEDKLSYTEMQTTIQKLVVNAESKGFGEATILLHRFSAELRKAQDGRITNFFHKVKDP
jgi:hypothetical protein